MARRTGDGVREGPGQFFREVTQTLVDSLLAFLSLEAESGDGKVRDHVLKAAAAGSEAAIGQLQAEAVPAAGLHVWEWFWDLRAAAPDGFGRSPITYQEIDAWIRCTGLEPRPWEIRAIRAMDLAFHDHHRKRREKDGKKSGG